jgi:sporulation protein YlmC with PRC-barrel domain
MAVMDVKRLIPATRMEKYDVKNPQGEDLGQVQNFMVDPDTGRIAFVVAAFGGVLGMTDKWIAIPLDVLRWDRDARQFIMDVPRETLERAPGLDKDKWPEEFDLTWMEDVYTCFGCRPYWVSGTRWVLRGAGGAETLIISAAWLRGRNLKDGADQDIGKIDDLIIDLQSGYMTYAAVDLSYDELRDKKLAIPIEAFMITPDTEIVHLSMERDRLRDAPVFDPERVRIDHDSVSSVYAYYGYQPYWKNRAIWGRRGTVHPAGISPSYQPDLYRVSDLLGNTVRDPQGDDVGKMEDLMIDLQSGYLASAIITLGGIPELADKYYPVPLEVLSFDPVNHTFHISVDRETLEQAPAFDRERLPKVDRQGLIDVYAAYGYTPYWKERVREHV